MSKRSTITAIPIDQPEGLIVAQMTKDEFAGEPTTDAQEMSELTTEVNTGQHDKQDAELDQVEDLVIVQEDAPKAKAKRAPQKSKVVEDLVVNVISTHDEVVAEVEVPNVKSEQKVSCPDCGKHMSAKTLKYSHAPNCVVKKTATPSAIQRESISDEIIEQEIEQRMTNKRSERMAKRQKDLEKLIAGAL